MRRGGLSGIATLAVMCGVLMLCVFAMLAASAASKETAMARAAADSAVEYYRAERTAGLAVAELRSGGTPDGVEIVRSGDRASFSVPAGNGLELRAVLDASDGYRILEWKLVYAGEWVPDGSMDLLDPGWDIK